MADEPERQHSLTDDSTVGVAISGGGLRATLFSLGVVLYLTHSGLNRRIRLVTSVSGGSITNALMASSGDYSKVDVEAFDRSVGRLAHTLAQSGSFFFPRWSAWLKFFAILLIYPVVMGGLALLFGLDFASTMLWVLQYGLLGYVGVMLLVFLAWLLVFRRSAQIGMYGGVLAQAGAETKEDIAALRKELAGRKLKDVAGGSVVQHVFCATELVSGRPFYMSPARLSSPAFGSCDASGMKMTEAIYASAAFPAVFPPLRKATSKLRLRGGDEPERPSRLVLADGGVYNNLGTDWFEDANRPMSMVHDFGGAAPVTHKIIVNASAPRRVRRIAGWWPWRSAYSLVRIFGVMYENTVGPRLEGLRRAADEERVAIVDIAFSTGTTARALCKSTNADTKSRAKALATALSESSLAGYLEKIAQRSAGTKTTLSRIGETGAVQLLIHGYVSALVACHSRFGSGDELPDRSWFEALLDPSAKSTLAAQPPAATARLTPELVDDDDPRPQDDPQISTVPDSEPGSEPATISEEAAAIAEQSQQPTASEREKARSVATRS